MAKKYLTCAETAKLVRAALKEAFPGVKFSVRSSTYSGGASMGVKWMDGPNTSQVDAVVNRFKGSYFDGSIDYQGSIYHMIDGQEVSMGADYIFTNRSYSADMVARAIDRLFYRYAGNLKGMEKPTAEDFLQGQLWHVRIPGLQDAMQHEINAILYKQSDRLKVERSTTAGKVMVIGDDGYSRQCGSGRSAVSVSE
ncbi:MAG: hypothetical protein KGI91_16165 [Burkholderiales bacterium]|nr:hypothetical protein [Burkholderiales bacterium]